MKYLIYTLIAFISIGIVACSGDKDNTDQKTETSQIIPKELKDVPGIEKFETSIDYSNASYWISLPTNPDKDVDVIYYYPTAYFSDDITKCAISDIDDAGMVATASNNIKNNCLVFSETCNIYAPLYRQSDVAYASSLDEDKFNAFMNFTSSQDPTIISRI